MLIGLSGYARAGKNEVAKILIEEFGFEEVAFADKLRECLYALNPIVDKYNTTQYLQEVIDTFGWDGYKETIYKDEIRRLLQNLGTEVGREILGENIWVDSTLNFTGPNVVVTDVRFPNEAFAIKLREGMIYRVERPGVVPINNHISETALDAWKFDEYIDNHRDLDYLRAVLISWFEGLGLERIK